MTVTDEMVKRAAKGVSKHLTHLLCMDTPPTSESLARAALTAALSEQVVVPSDDDDSKIKFHIRVNGGPEQTIAVKTGIYRDAAAAVPALLGLDLPINVEIWAPHLLPDYASYFYRVRQNEFVGLVTEILVPR